MDQVRLGRYIDVRIYIVDCEVSLMAVNLELVKASTCFLKQLAAILGLSTVLGTHKFLQQDGRTLLMPRRGDKLLKV